MAVSLVRSPRHCTRSYIDTFVSKNEDWVLKHLARAKELEEQKKNSSSTHPPLSEKDRSRYIENCKGYLHPEDRILRPHYGRLLRPHFHPGAEDPLGKLQQSRAT